MKIISSFRFLIPILLIAIAALSLAWWKTGDAANDNQACLPGQKRPLAPVYGDSDLYSVNTGPGVIKQSDSATRPQLEAVGDFSIEVKVMVTGTSARDATAGIYFNREDKDSVYHFGIFPNEDRWKVYEGANRLLVADGYYEQGLDDGRWHTLRVDVGGLQARASIDGVEVTDEPIPLLSDGGTIGIRMRDSAASFEDLVLLDAGGNVIFSDDFSAGLDGWIMENESLWRVGEFEGDKYVSGDVLVDVETLLSPEFSPRLDPHFLMLDAAGANTARVFFFWDDIQSSGPDAYYWNNMDALLITARDHGIEVLASIVYAPVWAIAPENRADSAAKAFPPMDVSDYGNFVAEAVSRYKPGGVLAQEQGWDDGYGVTAFQIGHEYNAGRLSGYARTLFAGWMGDLDQYVDMLKEGHDAVKGECPGCIVVSGPATELLKPNYETQLDPTGERQYLWQGVEDLYSNIQARHPGDPDAADKYFDVLSLHVYEWFVYSRYGQNPDRFREYEFPDYRWYQDRISMVTEVMEQYGDANKDIWVTEVTYASADNGDPYRGHLDEAGQAEALDMVYRELSRFDQVKKVFWWYSIDSDTYTGLIRRDMTGKPSYVTFARLSGAIGEEADLDACSLPQVSFIDDESGPVLIENPASDDANVFVYADGYLCAAYNIEAGGSWNFQSWGNGAKVTIVSYGDELEVDYAR